MLSKQKTKQNKKKKKQQKSKHPSQIKKKYQKTITTKQNNRNQNHPYKQNKATAEDYLCLQQELSLGTRTQLPSSH
jgi:hypothetical protein